MPASTPPPPLASSILAAPDLPTLQAQLAHLRAREADLTASLDARLAAHTQHLRALQRIDLTRARLSKLSLSARALASGPLSSASSTAATISAAVERLDTEQDRVRATLAVVEQVSTLKQCVLGVTGAMGAPQDWENAAAHLERARQIPRDVVHSGFAEATVPTAEVPDPPSVTLDTAAESLCALFLHHFEKAAAAADGATITRFFKMFPQIGRADAGLKAYARYVCGGVAARARQKMNSGGMGRKDGAFYVDALTSLFEHIAQVVDGHAGLVERHYGRGTMATVMARLHAEIADVQGGIVLDTWSDERGIERKLTDVKSYAFSFLVQSFLAPGKAQGGGASGGGGGAGSGGGRSTPQPKDGAPPADDGIEMKEVDAILNEIGGMMGGWGLYVRFVSTRASQGKNDPDAPAAKGEDDEEEDDDDDDDDDTELVMPDFLQQSNLPKKIAKLLMDPFGHFATFFLRRSVEKAFQLEEFPTGLTLSTSKRIQANPPYITSVVDDVMYIVSQLVHKSIATASGPLMTGVVATIARVLGSDFIGMMQRKMRDECYPKAAIQGALPPDDKIVAFVVLINNLDIASEYVKRITHQYLDIPPPSRSHTNGHATSQRALEDIFPMGREAASIRQSLKNLESSFTVKAGELQADGVSVAFAQIVKPRLRPLLSEVFKEIDAAATEAESRTKATNGYVDEDVDSDEHRIRQRFQHGWDNITKPMRNILTPKNAERLLATAAAYVSNLLEKRMWSYQGRIGEHGSLALEKHVSDLANAAVKGANFKLRETFTRCFQITTILTMEEEEWEEIKSRGEEADEEWALSEGDRIKARNMLRLV